MSGERLDDIVPAFRAAKERWLDAPNLQQHYDDLARTFEENGSSLIELTKSFLEMVCLTVINELGATPPASSSPTTSELLSCALDALDLRNQRGASALGKVISGHNKLADGLAELRNQDGTVAHGKDGFLDAISNRHARVYLLSADTIITLILNAFDGKEPSLLHTREPPDRFRHLNQRIDAGCALDAEVDETGTLVLRVLAGPQNEDDAIELRVAPSELLYYLDRQAYVSVLDALRGIEPMEAEEAEKAEASPVTSETEVTPAEAEGPEQPTTARPAAGLQLLTEYQGRFADKATPFYEFLIHSLLGETILRPSGYFISFIPCWPGWKSWPWSIGTNAHPHVHGCRCSSNGLFGQQRSTASVLRPFLRSSIGWRARFQGGEK